MTLVDHSRDHDLAVQGSQAARARALQHLLEMHDLPTISNWTISDIDNRLSGLVMPTFETSSDDQRAIVAAWAAYLHGTVTEVQVNGRTEVHTEGWSHGVRVRIWAYMRPAPKEAI